MVLNYLNHYSTGLFCKPHVHRFRLITLPFIFQLIISVFGQLGLASQLATIEFVHNNYASVELFNVDHSFTQELTLVFNRLAGSQSNSISVSCLYNIDTLDDFQMSYTHN